ncbi:MAG: MoaD/ThiS family protein [Planctomycetes bacterium]|nr:MoaD/ThiS family protein [Planctomycetota bacterium]
MVRITFTENLVRHVACPEIEVEAGTVGEALEQAFRHVPALRGYVLDDQGEVRKHVIVLIDGQGLADRARLGQPLGGARRIHVLQALSGG